MSDRTRRIGVVCGAGYISGKEVMALELASGLKEIGWDVSVVTTRWGNGDLFRRLQILNISAWPMWLGYISATLKWGEIGMTTDQLVHLPSLYSSFRRFLHEHAPEKLIHTNWQHVLLLRPFLRPERDIFWVHEIVPNKASYRKLFSGFSRRLGLFVAVSNAVRKSITDLGVPQDQVVVIHNGISPFPITERASGLTNVRIGIVGQVGEWKGHDDLVEAFAEVLKRFPGCELHIFGEATTPYSSHLRELIRKRNLNDHVHWEGFESERSKIYSKIDICVVPSRFEEPFGLVAVEAAMAGLPCVVTRRGGLPEIVKDKVTGFVVEVRQPDLLAAALMKLTDDPDLRRGMGIASRQAACERFSRELFVKQFADILEKC